MYKATHPYTSQIPLAYTSTFPPYKKRMGVFLYALMHAYFYIIHHIRGFIHYILS